MRPIFYKICNAYQYNAIDIAIIQPLFKNIRYYVLPVDISNFSYHFNEHFLQYEKLWYDPCHLICFPVQVY